MLSELFGLDGKVAVITGASKGLGRGYAKVLASAGATSVCVARNEEGLKETVDIIENDGNLADYYKVDVTDTYELIDTVNKIVEKYGKIDILVNNAGTEIPKDFVEVTEEEFDTIMNTNVKGVYFTTQAVVPFMQNRKEGKIINIGSLGSHIGLAKATVYSTSKGGILQLTRALALELAPYNIQVNALGPGYYHTDMTDPFFKDPEHKKWIEDRIPLGRIGREKDLYGALVMLAGSGGDYITGQIINVDGGWLAGG